MPDFPIWSIIAAAAAAEVLGYCWYHPVVFGKVWMRLSDITPEMAEHGTKHIHIFATVGFFMALLGAYVLQMLIMGLGIATVADAVRLACWLFAGFVAPILLGSVLWEHRRVSLYLINAGYWLLVLCIMAAILAL